MSQYALKDGRSKPSFMTAREVAEHFGWSMNTLYTYRKTGAFPVKSDPTCPRLRFNRAEVLEWAEDRFSGQEL